MTQIQTPRLPNINQGPRGIGARAIGGAYTQDCISDITDGDSFQNGPIELSGTTDVINPHISGNYVIKTGSADAITLGAPTALVDDCVSINIWSDTAFAHTVILPSALFASGQALHGTATFPAFRGAGMSLRAYNGAWHVVGTSVGPVVFSA
jgi:hypothetical protein